MSNSPVSTLTAHSLRKKYKARTVVEDVSFEVKSGEVVGLLGPNGAGKTTCFYMIVGLVPADGGDVYIDNAKLTHLPMHSRARRGLSYLPQEASVFRKLNVEENIRAVLELLNLPESELNDRLEGLLAELHVEHVRHINAAALSGGERRRVEIARALVTVPRFILLDEPFSGVDPRAVEELQSIIREMKRRNLGVLITDHSVRETLTVTDRSYIIHEGKVMVSGTAEELVNNSRARELYFGERFYMDLDARLPDDDDVSSADAPDQSLPKTSRRRFDFGHKEEPTTASRGAQSSDRG